MNKFHISPFFPLIWAGLLLFNRAEYVLYLFFAALIHETAHIVLALLFRADFSFLTLQPFGISASLSSAAALTCAQEILVSLAGIAANLIAAVLCLSQDVLFSGNKMDFVLCNTLLAAVNLLPIEPLDGGRALYYALLRHREPPAAQKISRLISLLFLFPLAAVSVWLLLATGYNFSLLLIVVYLFVFLFVKKSF